MFDLKEQVAAITGASSGLGRQMARAFAAQGANLVIMARRLERLKELKDELEEQYHVRVLPVQCDVTNTENIKEAAQKAEAYFGRVDILLNCAGSAKNNGVLEMTDDEWDFYYSEQRLQRIVDNHDVHITHVYPAWVRPGRTFWTYDADSTIVALPGMNRAFARIAKLRDEHKMLPMTVKTYLDYYSGLLNVSYEIIDAEHILLHNTGKKVKGFTLLCPSPIRFEDNRFYEFRKSGDYYYIWFNLEPNDNVLIRIINN